MIQQQYSPRLPRVLFIGDSIRMAYVPLVQSQLEGKVEIIENIGNGGDSRNVRKRVKKWLKRLGGKEELTLVHFNCGLHDIKRKFGNNRNQQSLTAYQENLEKIITMLQEETMARLAWATTTPVIFQRHHAVKGFDRFEEDVKAYNSTALKIMEAHGIIIDDLNQIITDAGVNECISGDGVHMTEYGNSLLADAVKKFLMNELNL